MALGRGARSAELASLGARVGAGQALTQARKVFASAERRRALDTENQLRTAEQVVEAMGQMKGAMMKLAQMASYVDEGVPETYRDALATLQADAPPMAPQLAADVVERELGGRPETVFAEWDPVPIAAASIGQVHRAITRDARAVAVKVQYPGIDEAIRADLGNGDLLFNVIALVFPGFDPAPVVAELRERLTEELDYTIEAANQRLFADFYRGHPFIHVPDVLGELSSGKVLTSELATGARFDEVVNWAQDERDLAAETIFRFVFRSLYRLQTFNGDPHPGNYLFRPGGRVTFLDFGLVKRFTDHEMATFQQMIRTIVLDPNPGAFRATIEQAGLLQPGAPVDTASVVAYFNHFYSIVQRDELSTMTPEYSSASLRHTFDPHSPIARYASVPSEFVLIQRINLGLYAILARLRATANWRRIAEELWPMVNGLPSTPLGELEAAWLAGQHDPQLAG